MLTFIRLINFKCFHEQQFPLGKINVFIGQNGTGKSTVAQSIALLKQSNEGDIKYNGTLLDLGNFNEVKNNRTDEQEIAIQFGGYLEPSSEVSSTLGITEIKHSFVIEINDKGFSRIGYSLEGEGPWKISGSIKRNGNLNQKQIEYEGGIFVIAEQSVLRDFVYFSGGNQQGLKTDYFQKISQSVQKFLGAYGEQLLYCRFIPATRGFDQASYQLLDFVEKIETSKGVTRQSEMAVTSMAHDSRIPEKINYYLKQVLPDSQIQTRNLPQKKIAIVNKDEFGEYKIINEGFGLNQSIYLFMELAIAKPNSTIFIDEPEISLHPASQARLSSLLVDVCKEEDQQMIITTHSEHILLGLIERIIEKGLHPNTIKIYYFEKEGGVSKVTHLPVNDKGEIEGGMKGFFEQDLNHIDKFIDRMKKK